GSKTQTPLPNIAVKERTRRSSPTESKIKRCCGGGALTTMVLATVFSEEGVEVIAMNFCRDSTTRRFCSLTESDT
ncbi:hypothetical protein A2U01_0094931, partial [Trifolium medium]|nr:hypothetical protein [Trifolium medium]